MSASEITLARLQRMVHDFTEARGWTPAHDPKNLAMSVAIEAAELMEHFQWGERSDYGKGLIAPDNLEEIRLEVADIMIYLLSFCNALGIDPARSIVDKVLINDRRWPVESQS